MNKNRVSEARGINVVSEIIQEQLYCGWQEFDHINDNGLDGILIDRKRGIDTGFIYYIQIKSGDGYLTETKKRKGFLEINLGKTYIEKHKKLWHDFLEPVILIYVDSSRKAWWVNLKSESIFCEENKGIILIPKYQRFAANSMGDLRRLRKIVDFDRKYDVIKLSKEDSIQDTFNKSSKIIARDYYRKWSKADENKNKNPVVGNVIVSRVGWRHICLKKRKAHNILQSFKLIGAARTIIKQNTNPIVLRTHVVQNSIMRVITEDIALRSRILFSNRQESVVEVILKRKRIVDLKENKFSLSKCWFYSVHEYRRKKMVY